MYNKGTVKQGWWEHARMSIIASSLRQLVKIADKQKYENIILNFPGIGAGKLDKRILEIKKILTNTLDDRFVVVSKPKEVK